MSNTTIFEFETDFAGTLRCIPMIVRFKLDHCGIKLSLKQWSRFNRDERAELVNKYCDTLEHIESYRNYLVQLIEDRAKDNAVPVAIEIDPLWSKADKIPQRLSDYVINLELPLPQLQQWAALTNLQRFALFKLTRPGHDNDNFVPAMREFGLLSS